MGGKVIIDYCGVDVDAVEDVIENVLPSLKQTLEKIPESTK
jgi:uncharacterized protein with HEPN domain